MSYNDDITVDDEAIINQTSSTKSTKHDPYTAYHTALTTPAIALVCQSNLNRSMEAHHMLANEHKYTNIHSYGIGTKVRLPGLTQTSPAIYDFGSHTYQHIYTDLAGKNLERYTKNGILWMLQRDMKVKPQPERFQHQHKHKFDLIICYELRVYDSIYNELCWRHDADVGGNGEVGDVRYCYVVNIETVDNHSEALNSANLTLKLVKMIYDSDDWRNNIDKIVTQFEQENSKAVLYTVVPY